MAEQTSANKIGSIAEALDILVAVTGSSHIVTYGMTDQAFTYLTARLAGEISLADISRIFNISGMNIESLGRGSANSSELGAYSNLLYQYLLKPEEDVPAEGRNGSMSKSAVLSLLIVAGKQSDISLELIGQAASCEDPVVSNLAMSCIRDLTGKKNSYKANGLLKAFDKAASAASIPADIIKGMIKYCRGLILDSSSSSYEVSPAIDLLRKIATRPDADYDTVKSIILGVFPDVLEKDTTRPKPPTSETDSAHKEKRSLREALKHATLRILEKREDMHKLREEAMEKYLNLCSTGNWMVQAEAVFFLGAALRRLPDVREGFQDRVFRAFELLEKNNDGKQGGENKFIMNALNIQEYKLADDQKGLGRTWRRYEHPAAKPAAASPPQRGAPLKQR